MTEKKGLDITYAQDAALRYLESKFGKEKILSTTFSKTWYSKKPDQILWEVEGDCIVKKRLLKTENFHFTFQIDHESGKVIGFVA